ncbi:MAG: hypothetical protein KA142_01460 [Chromatiaceae bacterium]|nr:hypothetical protein [Chromatiaceae bacterium]
MKEMEEWKARHDLDTLRETVRVEKDRQRMKRVRKLAREEINELAYAASLHVEISR